MKRFLILLLSALLLFSGCVNEEPEDEGNGTGAALTRFVRTEDGTGYKSELAGIAYYPLDVGFEAAKTGTVAGNYVDEKFGYTMTFGLRMGYIYTVLYVRNIRESPMKYHLLKPMSEE